MESTFATTWTNGLLLTKRQWLFIVLAIISVGWSALMLWLLPDTPENARFLSRSQKLQAMERVRGNQMTLKSNVFQWDQFVEALLDLKVLVVCLFLIGITVCNSSLTAVSGQAS